MPYVSVVLPCFRVQAYVRECLDSLLQQTFTDIEVVAVDDASPDHTGAILDEYAERDDRVRVIHLDHNVGLGEARNIGLDAATGDYVLFVDSDDYLVDGSLEAIAERLRATKPDVMFFDYARSDWTRTLRPASKSSLLRTPVAPDVFTLAERESVLDLFSAAWNRAYRREFLNELGLRYAKGYYEEIPVSYPVLLAADRISILDRLCYVYRQRRGAITKTASSKHFDLFGQYDKVFAFIADRGEQAERFRPGVFHKMMEHYIAILKRQDRVPPEDRERFFNASLEHYRRYKPKGFTSDAPDFKALSDGSYRRFERHLERIRANGQRASRAARRRNKRISRKRRLVRRVRQRQYRVYLKKPLDESLAVFESYWYRPPSCNPGALYDKVKEMLPHIRPVWVAGGVESKQVPEGYEVVVLGSVEYHRALARAKYFVNNVNFPQFVVKRPGSVHLQTQHGTPLKAMGLDLYHYPAGAQGMNMRSLLTRADRWDYNLSSNQHSSEIWERVFPCRYEMLEYGYPRNDRYYNATADEITRLREGLGISPGTTAILYAPTWREYRHKRFQSQVDLARLARSLPEDQVLLVRTHHSYGVRPEVQALQDEGLIIDVSGHRSTEDLCLAADVLLTDYSSIMFDYANLDRPIVILADDWDAYRRVRGVYFDLPNEAPGIVAVTEGELIEALGSRSFETEAARQRLSAFRRRFCPWDDGHAAERVVQKVFLGQEPAPPIPFDDRVPAPTPASIFGRGAQPRHHEGLHA